LLDPFWNASTRGGADHRALTCAANQTDPFAEEGPPSMRAYGSRGSGASFTPSMHL
jgi:hypothetical protein